jgi:signal peptidase I
MNQSEQYSQQTTNNKEPWLAVNLSKVMPGIGQIYAGKTVKGYIILSSFFLLLAIGIGLIINPGSFPVGIVFLAIGLVFLPIWNLFDAYSSAKHRNSLEFESERKQNKDPWLAVFLSSFIPGLGHAYLRKWVLTILFLAVFVAPIAIPASPHPIITLLVYLVQLILPIVVLYNVYVSAPVRRERSRRTIGLLIAGLVGIPLVLGSGVAILIRVFIAETRYIPSGSMLPTLQIGDRLIVDKFTYRYSSPKRGDIVVFSPTAALQEQNFKDAFINRIIGLPGDRVDVRDGKVLINGQIWLFRNNYVKIVF